MQRLHDADPTGDLLKDGGYYHLKLPAYATRRVQIDLRGTTWAMEEGDYLSPRLDKKVLDKLRIDLGEYHFSGQYMQEPVPIGGGEFKAEWVMRYAQGSIKPKEMNVVILVDPAGGEELNKRKKKLSDWTAMMVVGLAPDNNYYLLDVIRDRLNPTDRINTLFMLHRKWNALCGKPPKVGYEKYGMMTDTHYIEEKKRTDAYNFNLIELGGSMMKEERIRRLIPDMQNSRWYFPDSLVYVDNEGRKFDLVQEILTSEMPTFPRARFDDMLDALSRIYEEDLSMVFPKPKLNMVDKAMRQRPSSDSWENF
jgi:predicted phage terminase large subunit-like protein